MAKKTAAGQRKQASDDAAGEAEPAPSSAKRYQRKKQGAWPSWLWVVGGFAVLLSLGRVFTGDSDGAAARKRKASDLSPARFLELALRLQEMTEIASALASGDELDSDAAKQLDAELKDIEAELGTDGSPTSRDLRSMVSVVRGTLYQKSEKLTDEEVEGLGKSFTYANPRYWDDYYNRTTQDEIFDWYGTWDTPIDDKGEFVPSGAQEPVTAKSLGDLLRLYLTKDSDILMFGCGNSDLSEKMYVDGFEGITNIDISEKLLANLRSRLQEKLPKMKWVYMNASALTFEDSSFDVIIDKGTLDAIEQNRPLLLAAAAETHRALRPGGLLLSVTFNDEEKRVTNQLREVAAWGDCRTHAFERVSDSKVERSGYFLHACRKK